VLENRHLFLIRKLELFLLHRIRTTDNVKDCKRLAAFPYCVFDESSETMQAAELEECDPACERSRYIYWFQNGKWPEKHALWKAW
jgi:hypothetical protein